MGLKYRWVCVEDLALFNRRTVAQCLTYAYTKVEPESIFLSDSESDIPDGQPYMEDPVPMTPLAMYGDGAPMFSPPRVHNVADTLIYRESAEEASMTHPLVPMAIEPMTPPELVPMTPPELVPMIPPLVPMMAPPLTPLGAPAADSAMERADMDPWADSQVIGDYRILGQIHLPNWAARARQFLDHETILGAPVADSAIESSPLIGVWAALDAPVADTLIYPDSTVESIPPDAQMPITSMEMEVNLDMEIIEDIIGGHDRDVDEVIHRIVIGYSRYMGTASTSRETS